ncbi:MAG: type II toxin-antitoxin system VapC family toxin [Proteobacteria bacterium]|jgi:PIN domain nuclease of toxin-antitoxin system|nr:type II toxin-antitoxin system VapC family toxin [Pseudomonadota bacterium]
MRILLDTHVWLWMIAEPDRLNAEARERIADRGNDLFLSAASAWEIAIKHRIGRLPLPAPPEEFVPARLVRDGVIPLPVEHRHALRVASLPALHRDPFGRLLVAQAQIERLVLATADAQLAGYAVETLRADKE